MIKEQEEIRSQIKHKENLDVENQQIFLNMLESLEELKKLFFDSRSEHLVFEKNINDLDHKTDKIAMRVTVLEKKQKNQ